MAAFNTRMLLSATLVAIALFSASIHEATALSTDAAAQAEPNVARALQDLPKRMIKRRAPASDERMNHSSQHTHSHAHKKHASHKDGKKHDGKKHRKHHHKQQAKQHAGDKPAKHEHKHQKAHKSHHKHKPAPKAAPEQDHQNAHHTASTHNGSFLGVKKFANIGNKQEGEGTYYGIGLGACGVTNSGDDRIVALSQDIFDLFTPDSGNPNNNGLCGRKIKATYKGQSTTVTVVDRCVGCAPFDLDFSPAAAHDLSEDVETIGRMTGVEWSFID